jgi:hypothetical protein
MFFCRSGTFIGVDGYRSEAPTKAIYSAASDARRLEHYFAAADSRSAWNSLTGSEAEPVLRLDVLQAIHRWVRGVQRHDAGLLYFAGHGLLTDQGLVLAASDFTERLPLDSGIALTRVVELIEQHGHGDSRYVIMLDCCREANQPFSLEKVTSNIAVLYACAPGELAIETDEGGAYASAIVSWLESESAAEVDGIEYCTLDGAADVMRRVIAERLGHAIQVPEQFGANPREIALPRVQRGLRRSVYDKGAIPRVCIRSSRVDGGRLKSEYHELRLKCFQYCALSLNNFDDALEICEVVDNERIEVWLDFAATHFDLSAFFDFIVYRTGELFVEVEIYWNKVIAQSSISQLASILTLNSVRERGATTVLFWEAAVRTHGRITFESWNGFATRAKIECRRAGSGGSDYPLVSMMPQLSYILRSVIALDDNEGTAGRGSSRAAPFELLPKPDAKFLEYCRFAEAAFAAGFSPEVARFRGTSYGFSCAALGNAILHEFWLLLCTDEKRYVGVRSKTKKAGAGSLAAITAYVGGKFGLEAAAAAAAVSATAIVVKKVGVAALCSIWGEHTKKPARTKTTS